MALFRRGKNDDASVTETAEPAPQDAPREHGPWDRSDVPGPEGRLDLGALWLPGVDGMELRLEIDQANGAVAGVTAVVGPSALQLQAFAAPRTLGIWDDIRDELVESIRATGGEAEVRDGTFGTEIAAQLPQVDAAGQAVMAPVIFLGVDGPRWFLRGFVSGPAVTDPHEAAPLFALFGDTVVVRGAEAMAPRELLPLRLPDEAEVGLVSPAAGLPPEPDAPASAGDLNPLERGPEITEVR